LGICDRIRRDRLKRRKNGRSKEVGVAKEEPN
jgi:hypothetical protein